MQNVAATPRAIRVLVDGTDWLADAVKQTLRHQPDMRLVGDRARAESPMANRMHRVDVIVTSLQESAVQWKHRAMFFASSGVTLLAISEDRSRVEVFDRWVIREVGLERLAAAIREVARHKGVPDPQQRQ